MDDTTRPSHESMADDLMRDLGDPEDVIDVTPETGEVHLPAVVECAQIEKSVFGSDPIAALEMARSMVQHMERLIAPRRKDFVCNIHGRDYPKVDWWTAAGQPLGLSPRVAWCRQVEGMEPQTFEARVEVYDRQGNMWSSAQALCSRGEKTWATRDAYALYSMAQTRATGKAYRQPLSFLAVLAGLEPTPAEEMPRDGGQRSSPPPQGRRQKPQQPSQSDDAHLAALRALFADDGRVTGKVSKIQDKEKWKPSKKGGGPGSRWKKWFRLEEYGNTISFTTDSNPEKTGWDVGTAVTFTLGAQDEEGTEMSLRSSEYSGRTYHYIEAFEVRPAKDAGDEGAEPEGAGASGTRPRCAPSRTSQQPDILTRAKTARAWMSAKGYGDTATHFLADAGITGALGTASEDALHAFVDAANEFKLSNTPPEGE